jgi:hypothetical protein
LVGTSRITIRRSSLVCPTLAVSGGGERMRASRPLEHLVRPTIGVTASIVTLTPSFAAIDRHRCGRHS